MVPPTEIATITGILMAMGGVATLALAVWFFFDCAVFQPVPGSVLEHHGKVGGAFTVGGYRAAFGVLLGCAVITLASSLFLTETLASKAS